MERITIAEPSTAADAASGAENARGRELTMASDRASVAESSADDFARPTDAPTMPEPSIGYVLGNRSEPVRISESGKMAVAVTVARARREAEGVKLWEAPISAECMKTRVGTSDEVTARSSVAAKALEGVARSDNLGVRSGVSDADAAGVCETA
jgi:hypothetical protein